MYFRNAFCTTSLCSPSRASILSGLYAHKHGVTNNFTEFPAAMTSFPEMLQQAGYATAYVGKWHMGEDNDEPRPGFDYFVTHKGQGKYFDTEFNVNGERREVRKGYYTTSSPTSPSTGSKRDHGTKPWTADPRPQGAAQLLHARAEVRARSSTTSKCRIPRAPSSSTTSRSGSRSGCARGTASTARSSSGARSSPTSAPKP